MSLTITTTSNGTLSLAPSDNPVSLTSTGAVVATAPGADAIDGGSGVNWQITNAGAVSSTFGYGINLAGPGAVADSGSISGTGGVLLSDDGSVTIASQGTVTATGLMPSPLATISAVYVTGPSGGGAISVNNAGVLNAANGYGIGLGASGSVINSGQVTGGEDGVVVLAGSGDIQNTGSIVATLDDGVGLFAGGAVANAAGASISGTVGANAAGIFITGGLGTITNSGRIAGLDYGVLVAADGTVTNNSTGTITGQNVGVAMSHGGTLSNSGAVSAIATGAAGADLELGGNINNYFGGSISGAWYGAFITGALGAVVNAGAISGNVYYGVSLNDGGSVENDATGSIVGQTAGVNLSNQSATVVNTGSITALGSGGAAVTVNAGGEVTNNSGGTLSGVAYGMFASGLSATFSNAGLVTGRDAAGLEAGGAVTNLAGGTLSGQNAGVYVAGGSGAVNNSGSIAASASGGAAIDLEASGSVTNNAGGTVTGSTYGIFSAGGSGVVSNAAGASISGGSAGIVMTGGAGTLTNSGAIASTGSVGVDMEGAGDVATNASGGTISGASYGVFVGGPGTVTNLGSISGGAYAVDFAANSNANLLQAGAGATFSGSVNGDGGALELLSGAGSIGGVSSAGQFSGFQSLLVDSGASWSLSGSGNSIANLTDNGALSIGGSLDVTGAVNAGSVGVLDLNAGGVLELAAATGSQTAVNFQGASQLVVDNAALFGRGIGGTSYQGSLLENFGAGDSCDILGFSALNASCAYDPTSGLLQVSNGSQQATLDFQQSTLGGGSFQIGADVSGNGVLITFQPATATVVSVATFEANQTQLDALVGGFSISDTAANVSAALDQLNGDSHVTLIALTDPPTPGLTLSVAQALNDSRALSEITTPHMLALADTAANIASILPTQASTLKAAGYTSVTSTTGAVTMTVAEAQLLSGDGIAVTGGPLSATGAAATMLALTASQASSLSGAGYTLVVLDTAADIQKLTTTQIAGLGNLHVTQIAASDTNVALKVAQAAALETAGIRVAAPAGSTVTVTDTSPNLDAMAAGVIAGLPALGVSDIVSTNGSVSIGVVQAIALENAHLRINGPGGAAVAVTMSDTGANIAAVTAGQMGLLAATGVSHITSTSGGVALNVAEALALESPAIKITAPTGSVVAVLDTALDIQALLTTQIAGLKAVGATILSASDANVSLTAAQAAALESAGVSLSPPSGGSDSVLDTAADIQKLTATQIAGLGNLHVTQITASDASVALTAAQAAALETAGIQVAAPAGSTVTDSSFNLRAMTAGVIAGLPALGVSDIVSTNGSISIGVAQAIALENAHLRINGPGGAAVAVTMSDTGANIATVTAGQMALLAATGVSHITSTSGGVTLNVAEALALESPAIKITAPTGSVVAVLDTALDIQALLATQIAGLKAVGATILSASDANVSLTVAQAAALESAGVSLSPPSGGSDSILDTAANIQNATARQIAGLGNLHVTEIAASDASVALTVAQAAALETAGIPVAAPGGSVTVSDTAGHLQALTVAQINGLPGIGVSGLVSTNANVSYSVAQTSAILADGLTVAAAGTHTITENFNNGYSVFESGALITQKSVNADGSYDIAQFNTGLGYSSYEDIFNSAGTKLLESRDMNDGSGALLLYANGLITNSGSGALSATTGADTFAFNPHSPEAITASGHTGETFEYDGQFGQSAITGFAATGSSHDLLQLDIASFSYLNASMTQAQDAAALLTNAAQSGANVVITDTLGSSTHDTLTLNTVTKTTLAANLSDFRFV